MPVSLIPHCLFDRYEQIDPAWLARQGITLLLSDLDFTLAPKSVRRPDDALRNWIAALRAEGIAFMIVSNNRSGRRVTEFCAELGVPYQGHARKPSPRGLEAAMNRAGADRRHTAMLGDKLLTDMLAANRCGVLALMVEPAGGAVTAWQKVLHALQAPFKAACRRRMEKRGGKIAALFLFVPYPLITLPKRSKMALTILTSGPSKNERAISVYSLMMIGASNFGLA